MPAAYQAPGPAPREGGKWAWLTLGVKEWDDAQLAFGHIKRMLQVMPGVGVLQLVKVDEVRPGDKG